jgi:hypothetical protein
MKAQQAMLETTKRLMGLSFTFAYSTRKKNMNPLLLLFLSGPVWGAEGT